MPATAERDDLRTRITHQIIEQLERGVRPWIKPWALLRSLVKIKLRSDGYPITRRDRTAWRQRPPGLACHVRQLGEPAPS